MIHPSRIWTAAAGLITGFALVSAAVVALVAGCSSSPSATATPAGTIPATAAVQPTKEPTTQDPAPTTSPAVPSQLTIPALGVDAKIVRVKVDDATGELFVPDDVAQVGWWQEGPAPGSSFGSVVLTGHIDSATQGLGALARLRSLDPGSTLTLTTSKGPMRYTVQARREYTKAELPVDVFSSVGAPRLVIVSCGGPFNSKTHHYRDNIVVYAVPV